MKIKFKNTDEDIKYMKKVLANEAFREGFKATRKIRIIVFLLLVIIFITYMKVGRSLIFMIFLFFQFLTAYFGFLGINLSYLKVGKILTRRGIEDQMKVFFQQTNSNENKFSELIVDGNEIIIKSGDNEKRFLVTFIKEIKEKGDYIYFKCFDGSSYFINYKYFENVEKIYEFINFIEINSEKDYDNDEIRPINEINNIIKSISYSITEKNLLNIHEYLKSVNDHKEITKKPETTIFIFLVVSLTTLTGAGYLFMPILGVIMALTFLIIIVYYKLVRIPKIVDMSFKKAIKKSSLCNRDVNIIIDENYICLNSKNSFSKYRLNKNFKAFEFNEAIIITHLEGPVMASIPLEVFESKNGIKEFLGLFD